MVADLLGGQLLRVGEVEGGEDVQGLLPVPARTAFDRLLEIGYGSGESLPYEDDHFGCAVAISTLEYVPDIDSACREIQRVLAPGGVLAVVTPGVNKLWDLALRLSTGESPSQYADRRQQLQPALHRHFDVVREVRVPTLSHRAIRLYTGLLLTPPA